MNPPSALQGAMGRERKPFTYTPGGLDLSEIKSERMAKRLMRNAMNQGVPELPPQVLSPSTPTTPIAVPNFNCLPVQVFPTLNLPANPKSLLRTRSTPEKPREPPAPKAPPPAAANANNHELSSMEHLRDTINNNTPTFTPVNNNYRPASAYDTNNVNPFENSNIRSIPTYDNISDRDLPKYEDNNSRPQQAFEYNRPTSMYEFKTPPVTSVTKTTYGSDAYTAPILPEISYDAEFCIFSPENSYSLDNRQFSGMEDTKSSKSGIEHLKFVNSGMESRDLEDYITEIPPNKLYESISTEKENVEPISTDFTIKPLSETVSVPATFESEPADDTNEVYDDNDQTVKVVKKQVKKKVESEAQQNGDQNGAEPEAEVTIVKLPAKKSAAKTETKVEVVKKTLPDGSVEETKKTITKTTVDGKTNITTKTETTIIPKAEDEVEEVEEEEEEEEGEVIVEEVEENGEQVKPNTVILKKTVSQEAPADEETVVKKEESSETTSTKKVVVVQSQPEETEEEEEEEEVEEVEEEEPTTVVIKKQEVQVKKIEIREATEEVVEEKQAVVKDEPKAEIKQEEQEEEEEEVEEVEEEVEEEVKQEQREAKPELKKEPEPEPEEEEIVEDEAEEHVEKVVTKDEKAPEPVKEEKDDEDSEYTEEEIEEEPLQEVPKKDPVPAAVEASYQAAPVQESETPKVEPDKVEAKPEGKKEESIEQMASQIEQSAPQLEQSAPQPEQPASQPEQKVPLREPSIPLEKVEDVEIKPIGAASETFSKTHTERTEIINSGGGDRPAGTLSTQTEYNRIENIVTVNRTTKTLDHSYEQITQQGIPTVKTYFAPGRERVSTSPQPSKPYQSYYTPPPQQPQTERRHSLLLERLSTERQMPSDIYQKSFQQQYSNQPQEQQRQWSQEPQSEVVNDSNVKPSSITNQQWYQQSRKENVIYNNIAPSTPAVPSQQWTQPAPPPQPHLQPQPQPQYHPQYQPSFTESTLHDSSKITSNSYQQNSCPSYTPAPSNWASSNVSSNLSSVNTQSNQYSYVNKSSESYQNTSQQYSSSYVPPPWEQDPSYVAPQLELPSQTQNFYQPPPSTNSFSPSSAPGWKPTAPAGKFSKPAPKSYIPPAPNQSFVKPVSQSELQKRPGSKTYYSEYERRYITVPESTYIPTDAKFQPQPDPSPQYYYDNNEPTETVEPEWRKELREFTEKTQTQTQVQSQQLLPPQPPQHQPLQPLYEQTSVNPPWEEDPKYSKVPTVTYNATPSWSQTLRPQSWRERSFESEYVGSNEWKTNTLGRSRPLSTYGTSNVETSAPERARGVSVDRYNPNKYQSPLTIPYDSEHGPVQSHTLDPTPAPHRGYHNPNVPAYHARASAEPREQPSSIPTPRNWGDSRTTPVQSRSFKYLQWITGTED